MYGPYHTDRCEAVAQGLKDRFRVVGVQLASFSDVYAWEPSGPVEHFEKVLLFPNATAQSIPWPRRFWSTLRTFRKCNVHYAFIYNYSQIENFLLAVVLRVRGVRTFCMFRLEIRRQTEINVAGADETPFASTLLWRVCVW